jgi:phage shock protein PspC (stress-responsive transcriptional regulator)
MTTTHLPPSPQTPNSGPSGRTPSAHSRRPLTRSRTDKKIAGVAGGLAKSTGIDAWIWRVAFLLLTTVGLGALTYCVLWILMPKEEKRH